MEDPPLSEGKDSLSDTKCLGAIVDDSLCWSDLEYKGGCIVCDTGIDFLVISGEGTGIDTLLVSGTDSPFPYVMGTWAL